MFAGKSPVNRAIELVTGTKLKDPERCANNSTSGGASAVAAAKDPMIELARLVDGPAREARKAFEGQEEIKQQAYGEIAKASLTRLVQVSRRHLYLAPSRTARSAAMTKTANRSVPEDKYRRPFSNAEHEHGNQPPFDIPKVGRPEGPSST